MKNRISSALRSTALATAALFLLMPLAMEALPNPIHTCQTISTDSSLDGDIVTTALSGPPCIIIAASNISFFLNGHTIDVRSEGMFGTAIAVSGASNVLIKGPGTVLTDYEYVTAVTPTAAAIFVVSGASVEVHDVTVLNHETGSSACPEAPFGIGIEFFRSGGNIHNNTVKCYQAGIDVSSSNPLITGNIGFNDVENNQALPIGAGITLFGSFGIGLRSSNNWNINNNTVENNGLGVSVPAPSDGVASLSGGIVLEALFAACTPGPASFCTPDVPGGGSSNNTVVHNTVMGNHDDGIGIGGASSGNVIVNNTSKTNGTDMVDDTLTGPNTWVNDRCGTESGAVPAGLCH